jgi:glycosyltransferase involved in cell wall biosynthesis
MKRTVLVIDSCQFSANYNYCLLDALARRGQRIVYATTEFAHGHVPDPPGVRVLRCFFYLARAAARLTRSAAVRRFLRAVEYPVNLIVVLVYVTVKRIPVVHLMWVLFPTLDHVFIRVLQWMGRDVVYTAHNPLPHEPRRGDIRRYCRIYRRADHVIALTHYTRGEIVSRCGVDAGRISVIPHGDFEPLFARYGRNDELAAKVREAAGPRRIVAFLGHIRPYKGLNVFVDAMPLIRKRLRNVFFLVAGSQNVGDDRNWRVELDRLRADGDLWADVRFLPVEDFKAYLSVTDVLVQPYVSASQSGNTAMAYAEGVPVVSTDVGGLREMTEDGDTGCIVPPGDAEAIAIAVGRLFEGDNYEAMARNARRAASERFNWETIAERTAAVYRGLGRSELR